MAARDKQHHSKNHIPRSPSSILFLSFLFFASFLTFCLLKPSLKTLSPPKNILFEAKWSSELCNYSDGVWIYDSVASARYSHTCREIFKGWNCMLSNKSNGLEITKWRWKPKQCDLLPFDPVRFLERHRDTSIVQDLLVIH